MDDQDILFNGNKAVRLMKLASVWMIAAAVVIVTSAILTICVNVWAMAGILLGLMMAMVGERSAKRAHQHYAIWLKELKEKGQD